MSVSTNSKILSSFQCRHDKPGQGRFFNRVKTAPKGTASFHGLSSLIFRFPPNFQRQLSIKARRNCSSIGVAQIVAASSSNNSAPGSQAVPAATAVDAASTTPVSIPPVDEVPVSGNRGLPALKEASFLSSDASLNVHAGERLGQGIVIDAITTLVVNTSAYFFKKTTDLIDFKIDGDLMTTAKFIDALKIPYIAPSYGGCESIVVQPAIMSYWDLSPSERLKYGIKDNLVRLSVGVEDHEDIKSDILWALGTI